MPSLFSSIFNQPCSHQFSWPERRSDGGHYQVCTRCGDQYVYDWETLARAAKITASGQSRTLAPQPSARIPRTQRFTVRKPIFYRQVNHSQYHLAALPNISASGLLLECHPSIPEGTSLEMILEMRQENTGVRKILYEKQGLLLVLEWLPPRRSIPGTPLASLHPGKGGHYVQSHMAGFVRRCYGRI